MGELPNYWEQVFQKLNEDSIDFSQSKPAKCLEAFVNTYLKKGDKVLDLGCGSGRNAQYLACRDLEVCGVDVSPTALEICKRRLDGINKSAVFAIGSLNSIPFPDCFFAAVVCIATLDHTTVEGARLALTEMRRVIKPSGKILLTFDPADTDEDILDEADILQDGTLRFVRGRQKGMLFRRYTDQEIMSLIGESNIVSIDLENRVVVCN